MLATADWHDTAVAARICGVIWAALCLTGPTAADCLTHERLGEALALVARAHPVLAVEHDEFDEIARGRNWDAYVRVGYALEGTNDDAAGLNASVQVKIPLFDRSTELATAKARSSWKRAEDQVRKTFLADLEQLCASRREQAALAARSDLYRDKLAWHKARVEEGYDKPDALWGTTERLLEIDADLASVREESRRTAARIARQYAGEHWTELLNLLEETNR